MAQEPDGDVVPPTLYLLVGPPGAGKTTLAKRLETEHRALRLTKDDWLMALFGRADLDRERQVVEDRLWAIAARALELGVDVVLDYGLWARVERDDYRARGEALGARVELRVLDAPPDELVRRLEARAERADPSAVPISPEQFAAYLPRYERPSEDELRAR